MRIAPHHIKGTADHAISAALGTEVAYTPVCDWPDDCMVQWGNGIIPANPFFEAFPPGTFIRGDGETIEGAERQAWGKYQRDLACDHRWGRHSAKRGTYLNGGGWCPKCDAFRGSMFREVVILGRWRKPLKRWERDHLATVEENHDGMNEHMDAKYPERAADRRCYARLLRIRLDLFGVDEESSRFPFFDDAPALSSEAPPPGAEGTDAALQQRIPPNPTLKQRRGER